MFSSILVPIDPDDPDVAAKVLEVAKGLASAHDAALTVISVEPENGSVSEHSRGEMRQRLERFLAEKGAAGTATGMVTVGGAMFPAIRSAAKEVGIDLIVLGSRDPNFVDRLLGPENGDVARVGDITLDRKEMRVRRAGREVHIGPLEFRLLECLLRRPGHVFTCEQLREQVWGRETGVEGRTVDVAIGRLRKALNHDAGPDPIRTVRAIGYALEEAAQ
jgi:DNA-binding winged helix-turn-helix (wHTH) protein/nucleotide-binding universal stress UspA family protein